MAGRAATTDAKARFLKGSGKFVLFSFFEEFVLIFGLAAKTFLKPALLLDESQVIDVVKTIRARQGQQAKRFALCSTFRCWRMDRKLAADTWAFKASLPRSILFEGTAVDMMLMMIQFGLLD
jgi:hypothetical protein